MTTLPVLGEGRQKKGNFPESFMKLALFLHQDRYLMCQFVFSFSAFTPIFPPLKLAASPCVSCLRICGKIDSKGALHLPFPALVFQKSKLSEGILLGVLRGWYKGEGPLTSKAERRGSRRLGKG